MSGAPDVRVFDLLPIVLPADWSEGQPVRIGEMDAARYVVRRRRYRLTVLVSLDQDVDGDRAGVWLHSSTSREGKLPSWDDLKLVHEVVHGDRAVVQLLPPRSSWLNVADCLHLFERMDAPTVPEVLWRRP